MLSSPWTSDEDEDFYICELMAPETVTGEVTRVDKNTGESDEDNDNTYVRIDGNKYTYASKNHNVYDLDEGKRQHPTLNEDYTLYMTPEGYILGYALADQSPTSICTWRTPMRRWATGRPRSFWRTAPPPR